MAAVAGLATWQWDRIGSLFHFRAAAEEVKAGGGLQGAAAGGPVVKVLTRPVITTSNDRRFEAVGTGRAILSVQLFSPVADEVREVLFKAGDRVEQGQLLVQLDDAEEQLAVRLAQVELDNARRQLERYETAGNRGAVPESEVDTARSTFEAAEVALEQAQLAVERRKIRAPFNGVLGLPNVDPGDRVSPDTVITNIDDRSMLYVDFEVPEALLGALVQEDATAIEASTPAFTDRTFDGEIMAQGSRVDEARRTLMMRARIQNEEDLLRPGMSFTTRWAIPGETYPTVPEISVQWGRQGSFLWVVREGAARRIPVQVFARTAGNVLVMGDISEGDVVVVEGLQRLRDGIPVQNLGESVGEEVDQ